MTQEQGSAQETAQGAHTTSAAATTTDAAAPARHGLDGVLDRARDLVKDLPAQDVQATTAGAGQADDHASGRLQVRDALHQLMDTARHGSEGVGKSLSALMASPEAQDWHARIAAGQAASKAAEQVAAAPAQAAAALSARPDPGDAGMAR